MPAIARLTDRTWGYCKVDDVWILGRIRTCSPNVIVNNLGVARKSDEVISDCGHIGTIDTFSPDTYANNLNVARLGDHYDGDYTGHIIQGSPDVFTNG